MKKIIPVVLLALLAAAVYGWRNRENPKDTRNASATTAKPAAVATPVEVITVEAGPLVRELTVVGSLRSNEAVTLRPEIAGRITRIAFEEGQRINRGALLVLLDDAVYRAEMAQAEASLDRSRRQRDSGAKLFADNYISRTEMDALGTAVKLDEAALAVARARLDKTRVRAPFDGVLGLRLISVGDYLSPGQDMVRIEDISPIKVDFRVPESFLPEVNVGQSLTVLVDAYPERSFEGKVVAIAPGVSPEDRSIAIRGEIPNDDNHLRPGLFARVGLVLSESDNALLVPEQAVVTQADGHFVYRVLDGKAARTPVEIGQRQAGRVEVRSGLNAGDTLITAGHLKLNDGKPVSVTPAPEASPATP